MKFCCLIVCQFVLFSLGCTPWAAVTVDSSSTVGGTSYGVLIQGKQLPETGPHYEFYRKFDRRYATEDMLKLLTKVAKSVNDQFPGSVLLIGDISGKNGGRISEHRSHRSGRDVDLAFFITTLKGQRRYGVPLSGFDSYGVGIQNDKAVQFDVQRNWAVVEALLSDESVQVQWIFISSALKGLLLRWALVNGKDMHTIEKAAAVMHQPSDSASHNDHFHVRIYCPYGEPGRFCTDYKPIWPWVNGKEKVSHQPSDEFLLSVALDGLEGAYY